MIGERDAVEWLRMMTRFSGLTDCKPHFARIADEVERLRAEVTALRGSATAAEARAA